jgi:hypothetical protein
MTNANSAQRQALISGLRALADFLSSGPDIPAPKYATVFVFPPRDKSDAGRRGDVDLIASRIGSGIEISAYGSHYMTSRQFGPVEYRAVAIPCDVNKESRASHE